MKVVLLKVSLTNLFLGYRRRLKEGERGVTRSIIDELHSSNIERDIYEGEGGVTESDIDELHSSDRVKLKVEVVLLEVSLMNFILWISKQIKWRVKVR